MGSYNESIQITISEEPKGTLSGERDLRFLYVYEGKVRLMLNGMQVMLQKDDFYLVGSGDTAEYVLEQRGFTGLLRMKYSFAADYLELRQYRVVCSSLKENGSGEERVGVYLRSMFSNEMSRDPAREALLMSEAYGLLYLLREKCRIKKEGTGNAGKEDENSRIEKIRLFLEDNYRERITLEDLSRETFFSTAYLSKYFKRKFGKNFSEALIELRLNHAMADLRETDLPITMIAMDNGFASPVAFTRFFRERYGATPSEFRQTLLKEKSIAPAENKEEKKTDEHLARIVEERSRGEDVHAVNSREVHAKVSDARTIRRFWNRMINGGTAQGLMRADMQEHLIMIHKELGVEYVRFWDIYAPEMMLYDGNPEKKYNFTRLDSVIEFLRRNDMRPYIEIGAKSNILLRGPYNYLVEQTRSRIGETPEQYGDFVRQMAEHYSRRYGLEEVEKWYFELWMETYGTDPGEYALVFETVQRYLKMVSPNLRLGGTGESEENVIPQREVLAIWEKRGVKPDFLTYYAYPYCIRHVEKGQKKKNMAASSKELSANYVERLVKMKVEAFHENGFWDQETHISEWNSTISSRNVANDSTYKGAYVVKNLLAMLGSVDLAGYWFASDLFTEYYDTSSLLNGSGGLLSKDGIRKPAYYGLQFLNRLEPYLLKNDEDAVITVNAHNSYSIICHNYRHPDYRYFTMEEHTIQVDKLQQFFDREKKEFRFVITGVKNGTYQIKKRVVDSYHGSVQDEWKRMGLTENLNTQDIDYLRRICVPYITIESLEVTNGKLDIRSTLEPNAIANIHIYLLE